ncbi:hypothetical protein SAMN06272735_8952 [Streptomyces sp. TLI_55]|nr:hypothetical protein SAMN06272735_8952 [Streptomyces sp. TLI_55]
MAADQFTQIANALFRDAQLSFKAKGIFGYVSTHRNGWQVTIADLVRLGPDGREAVRTGLQELEVHGYLIRERLRRPDGTLGEIVYGITDRPAVLGLAPVGSFPDALGIDTVASDALPAGIRRGVMAADQFTQVANGLFRSPQLSFKAKGLFGLLSTHQEGWRMTVADIARRGRDGESAVKSGLKELEKHGFLVREREREADGTLGAAAYFITDLPALQNASSQPESGFPPVVDPTLADPPTKNTNRKKTTQQNTSPLPPRARTTRTRHEHAAARTAPTPPAPEDLEPGVRLLLALGARAPRLLLTDQVLAEQGRTVTAMLAAGWTREQLTHVIADRPLPHPVRTTVGAIIAARLRAAQAFPPPATAGENHSAHPHDEPPLPPVNSAASRTVSEALTYRALVECTGCGVPGTAPGEDLCPTCLGWPPCRTCPGPTPRRAHPQGDGRCTTCASAFTDPLEGSLP